MSFWLLWAAECAVFSIIISLHKTALMAYHLPLHHSLLESEEWEALKIWSAIKAILLLRPTYFLQSWSCWSFPVSFESSYVFICRVMIDIQQLFSCCLVYILPLKILLHHPWLYPSHLGCFCLKSFAVCVTSLFTQPKMTNSAGESKTEKRYKRQIMKHKRQIRN